MESKNSVGSNLQTSVKNVKVGMDDAGWGPVMGNLVHRAMVCPIGVTPDGIKDSKTLNDVKRRSAHENLNNQNYVYKALHPAYITFQMESSVCLSNTSWYCVVSILDVVLDKFPGVEGTYIVTKGDCTKIKEILSIKHNQSFYDETKADAKYPADSDASIVPKLVWGDRLSEIKSPSGSG